MAERRMFSKLIVDSDAFLDMPLSTQALYFHLSMRADDEGFINNPKKIMRMIGASQNELELLIAKRFILAFDSGVIVIKHWKIHNWIRQDRIKATVNTHEKNQIIEKDNNVYTECRTSDRQVTDKSQHRLDEFSLDEVSIGKYSILFNKFWDKYPKKVNKKKSQEKLISYLKKQKDIDFAFAEISNGLNKYIKWIADSKTEAQFIKHPTTWITGECWNDELPEIKHIETDDERIEKQIARINKRQEERGIK